jgi:hypothetical protein
MSRKIVVERKLGSSLKIVLIALGLLAAATPFQNCSQGITHGSADSKVTIVPQATGGEGYDGKLYVVRGLCNGVAGEVTDAIQVETGLASAYFVRENCADIAPKTKMINPASLTLVPNDPEKIIYAGVTFVSQATKPVLESLKSDLSTMRVNITVSIGSLVAGSEYQLLFIPNVGAGSDMYQVTDPAGNQNSFVDLALPYDQVNMLGTILTVGPSGELSNGGTVVGFISPL